MHEDGAGLEALKYFQTSPIYLFYLRAVLRLRIFARVSILSVVLNSRVICSGVRWVLSALVGATSRVASGGLAKLSGCNVFLSW